MDVVRKSERERGERSEVEVGSGREGKGVWKQGRGGG